MSSLIWMLTIAAGVLLFSLCGRGKRSAGPSWFDTMPYLTQSQKQRTRLQQTHANRKARRRRKKA